MIGTKVGNYTVVEKLAEGGMGEVYVAHHELMGGDAIVKVLLPEMSARTDMVKRFFNEARAANSIKHPGIVRIFDMGTMDDGRAYLAMEKLRGEPLTARLSGSSGLPVPRAASLIRQLAGALGAAHKQGIVHRDLKPDNLFIVPDPEIAEGERIKVLDFGIAKLAATQSGSVMTAAGAIFGTPAYMAPEQCTSTASVDHRADLYAVGCIFYELVAGKPPFGHGGLELLAAHLRDTPAALATVAPAVPAEIEKIVMKLLAKDPDQRHASCANLIDDLDACAITVPPGAATTAPVRTAMLASGAVQAPQESRAHTEQAASNTAPQTPKGPIATTRNEAAGQVRTAQGNRRTLWGIGAAILVLGGAGLTGSVLTETSSTSAETSSPSDQEIESTTAPQAPSSAPQQPGPKATTSPENALLSRALDALTARSWTAAVEAAGQLLATTPDHAEAQQIKNTAQSELRSAAALRALQRAASEAKPADIVGAYADIPPESTYRGEAKAIYERARAAFLKPLIDSAQRHVKAGRCRRASQIAQSAATRFPDASTMFDELTGSCGAAKDAPAKRAARSSDPANRPQASPPPTGTKADHPPAKRTTASEPLGAKPHAAQAPDKLLVTGSGAPDLKAANVAVARLAAERAAKLDAYNKLLAKLLAVRRKLGKGDHADLKSLARQFRVVDTRYYSDGGVDIVVELSGSQLQQALSL